jgi:DNA-directed RNA polymerase specialized sigma24 family protein
VNDRPITDAQLVLLARAGEADALGALLERHRAPLYAAALTVLGDRDGAMDAVQDGTGRRHGIQAWSAEERAAIDISYHASSRCR